MQVLGARLKILQQSPLKKFRIGPTMKGADVVCSSDVWQEVANSRCPFLEPAADSLQPAVEMSHIDLLLTH